MLVSVVLLLLYSLFSILVVAVYTSKFKTNNMEQREYDFVRFGRMEFTAAPGFIKGPNSQVMLGTIRMFAILPVDVIISVILP